MSLILSSRAAKKSLDGIVKNHALENCARYGSILSGEVVKVIGSQLPDESWEKIEKALSIN